MIYFVQRRDARRLIKIGTTVRLSDRLKSPDLQAYFDEPAELDVLGIADGSYADEAALHQRFDPLRVVGEWFDPDDDLLAFIAAEARPWDGSDDAPLAAVKLHADVIRSARIVSSYRGETMTALLSDILRPILGGMEDEEHIRWRQSKAVPPGGGLG